MNLTVEKNPAIAFAALFLAALIIRGAFLATTDSTDPLTRWCAVCSDGADYSELAISLLQSGTYAQGGQLVAERPPLYSLFIAGIYAVAGIENFGAVRLTQVFLSCLTVLFVGQIARRLFGMTAFWIAGGLMAIYPFPVAYSVELYSETLFTFLLTGAMLLLFPYPDRQVPPMGSALAGGMLIGLSALTREVGLLLLPTLILWHWVMRRKFVASWLIAVCLTASVVVGSWTLRNYLAWRQFIPISTHTFNNMVYQFINVYHYDFSLTGGDIPASVPPGTQNPFGYLAQHDLIAQEKYAFSLAWNYCRAKPFDCVRAWGLNFIKLVSPVITNRPQWIVLVTSVVHTFVYFIGVWGLIKLGRAGQVSTVLFLMTWFLLSLVSVSLVHVEIRYRMPVVDPYLIIVGSWPVAEMWKRLRLSGLGTPSVAW